MMNPYVVRNVVGDDAPEARLYYGQDVRETLKQLPKDSVQMVVTSPPYWGLRSYGTKPAVWGGDSDCDHEWLENLSYSDSPTRTGNEGMGFHNAEKTKIQRWVSSHFCHKCGAWQGELGLEPTPDLFVDHLVEVFRDVRRVLVPGGLCWINLGDSYAGGGRAGKNPEYHKKHKMFGKTTDAKHTGKFGVPTKVPKGLKSKDLVLIPFRVCLALQEDGWWVRSVLPWVKSNCLSGGTHIYVRGQKGVQPMTLKDLARLDPSTLELWNGERWTQLVAIWETPRPDQTIELELRSGERIGCTLEHKWPTQRGFLEAKDIQVGDVIQTTTLPDVDRRPPMGLADEDIGWFVGLYIAEGSRSGQALQFSGHENEQERFTRLKKIATSYDGSCVRHHREGKGVTDALQGAVLNSIIDTYVSGQSAHTKHLSPKCWKRNNKFLRAVLDGYLSGDGGYEPENRRWRLGFCKNDNLARDLRTLSARVGVHLRLKRCTHKGFGKEFPGWRGSIRFDKEDRSINDGNFKHLLEGEVVTIRRSRARKFYDLTVADEPHLFALASGVLTHNCMPESVTDRPTTGHEYWFMLSKSKSYYYNMDAVRKPHSYNRWSNNRNVDASVARSVYNHVGSSSVHKSGKDIDFWPGSGRNRRTSDNWNEGLDHLISEQEEYLNHLKRIRDHGGMLVNEDGVPLGIKAPTVPYKGAHFACVDQETECLTVRGWRRYHDLQPGTRIFSYNLKSQLLEIEPIQEVATYSYQGDLVSIPGMLMTPNHRCVVQLKMEEGGFSAPIIVRADALKSGMMFPVASVLPDHGLVNPGDSEEFYELLGWVASKGEYEKDHIRLTQPLTSGLVRHFSPENEDGGSCQILHGDLFKRVKVSMPDRFIIPDHFLLLPSSHLVAFLRGFMVGDPIFSQKSKLDMVQAMYTRLGKSCMLNQQDNGNWSVVVSDETHHLYEPSVWDAYQGVVWCPRVNNGTWVARRGGHPFITGNTFPPPLIHPIILSSCPDGGTVLDPFSGSGTAGMVSLQLGRNFIGVDLNPDYLPLAEARIMGTNPLVEKDVKAKGTITDIFGGGE